MVDFLLFRNLYLSNMQQIVLLLLSVVYRSFYTSASIPKNQIILKNFSASVIAASFSGGHFGCLEFSDFGLL